MFHKDMKYYLKLFLYCIQLMLVYTYIDDKLFIPYSYI